jgi:hypothetical protein
MATTPDPAAPPVPSLALSGARVRARESGIQGPRMLGPAALDSGPSADAPSRNDQQAPSLQDCICALYEHSLVPVREIARLAGITERNIYATVRRRGCRPRLRIGPGGGRRIVLGEAVLAGALDAAAVQRAIDDCIAARERLETSAAVAIAAAEQRATHRRSRREAVADQGALLNLAQAMRALAAFGAERHEARPRKRGADTKHHRR